MEEEFKKIDLDGDRFVSKDELEILLRRMRVNVLPELINELMESADLNNDGRVSFEEFCKANKNNKNDEYMV